MQGMELQFGIAKPVAEFGDLGFVRIVQVLPRAENLYRADTRLLDPAEQCHGEPVVDEQVRRQKMIHLWFSILWPCFRCADRLRRPAIHFRTRWQHNRPARPPAGWYSRGFPEWPQYPANIRAPS